MNQTKQKPIWKILSIGFLGMQMIAEIWLAAVILNLDMLPTKFLIPVLAALVLCAGLTGALVYIRKAKGKFQQSPKRGKQIAGYILAVLITLGCLAGIFVLGQVQQTIDAVTEVSTISAVVDVYVRKDDSAATLADTKGYTFAVTDSYDWENTQKTLEAMEKELGGEVQTVTYPSVFSMVEALLTGQADAMILNRAYGDILMDAEGYVDIFERIRCVWDHSIEEKIKQPTLTKEPTQIDPEPTEEPKNPELAPFVMYLSGSDTRSTVLATSRSDVNILAVVNPETKQVLLINTPRDYYVPNPAGNGILDKLTHCGVYGIDCSVTALSDLYGAPVEFYAQINFTGFETLIDAIGGVIVDVDVETEYGKFYLTTGKNLLNGEQALAFARERYGLAGGDNARGRNQMKVIKGVINKATSGTTIITNYAEIMESLQGMFTTNFPQERISALVKMQLDDMAKWDVYTYAVTGTGGSNYTYSMPDTHAYVMYPNEETVEKASDLIRTVLTGEIITEEDLA